MSRKPPKQPRPPRAGTDEASARTVFASRDGLAAYTKDPASFPSSRVVYYNDKFTVINDLYPKASVHLLLLPRDPKKNVLAPQDAFDDATFLEDCKQEEKKVRAIVASELRRKFGKRSKQDQARMGAMESDDPSQDLPPGRDWEKEVMSGIHANPSMAHVHIHVMSKDMVSECMKKSNHYLSFTTDFFVGLDQFPLAEDDYRRTYGKFPKDMICWRCGKNFENKMVKLKDHLDNELKAWGLE
ncbi:HIT-like protein [Teratosphaeria nubilosa]|uniref:Aprataxin-like protein n=1 Tax=Teratosphaeria nubilosa TaxID=161662 RepID=A0A6G1L4J7_9PEZI|nr:HIT-like protein [Teratosphaeria nubilosa]